MLFEGRNMAYGAFKLRSTSSRRHLFSFFTVILVLATLFIGYLFYAEWESNRMLLPLDSMPPLASVEMNQSLDLQNYVEEHLASPNPSSQEPNDADMALESAKTDEYQDIPSDKLELDDIIKRTQQEMMETPKNAQEMLEETNPDQIYLVVDVMPEFPGGKSALLKFITSNMTYPLDAQRRKAQGRVVCEFIVNKDGTVSDIKVVKSVDAVLDEEAVRILKLMPHWSAGKRLGAPVRVKFSMPFNFGM